MQLVAIYNNTRVLSCTMHLNASHKGMKYGFTIQRYIMGINGN